MKKSARVVLAVLFVAMLLLPQSALAGEPVPKTNGDMTREYTSWWGEMGEWGNHYASRWEWNAHGADGDKAASGFITHTISKQQEDGTWLIVYTQTANVIDLVPTAAGTLEIELDQALMVYGGDPSWRTSWIRVVDTGKSGDQLWEWCWRCSHPYASGPHDGGEPQVWHQLSGIGHAKVH